MLVKIYPEPYIIYPLNRIIKTITGLFNIPKPELCKREQIRCVYIYPAGRTSDPA